MALPENPISGIVTLSNPAGANPYTVDFADYSDQLYGTTDADIAIGMTLVDGAGTYYSIDNITGNSLEISHIGPGTTVTAPVTGIGLISETIDEKVFSQSQNNLGLSPNLFAKIVNNNVMLSGTGGGDLTSGQGITVNPDNTINLGGSFNQAITLTGSSGASFTQESTLGIYTLNHGGIKLNALGSGDVRRFEINSESRLILKSSHATNPIILGTTASGFASFNTFVDAEAHSNTYPIPIGSLVTIGDRPGAVWSVVGTRPVASGNVDRATIIPVNGGTAWMQLYAPNGEVNFSWIKKDGRDPAETISKYFAICLEDSTYSTVLIDEDITLADKTLMPIQIPRNAGIRSLVRGTGSKNAVDKTGYIPVITIDVNDATVTAFTLNEVSPGGYNEGCVFENLLIEVPSPLGIVLRLLQPNRPCVNNVTIEGDPLNLGDIDLGIKVQNIQTAISLEGGLSSYYNNIFTSSSVIGWQIIRDRTLAGSGIGTTTTTLCNCNFRKHTTAISAPYDFTAPGGAGSLDIVGRSVIENCDIGIDGQGLGKLTMMEVHGEKCPDVDNSYFLKVGYPTGHSELNIALADIKIHNTRFQTNKTGNVAIKIGNAQSLNISNSIIFGGWLQSIELLDTNVNNISLIDTREYNTNTKTILAYYLEGYFDNGTTAFSAISYGISKSVLSAADVSNILDRLYLTQSTPEGILFIDTTGEVISDPDQLNLSNGNVGINVNNPASKLHVFDETSSVTDYTEASFIMSREPSAPVSTNIASTCLSSYLYTNNSNAMGRLFAISGIVDLYFNPTIHYAVGGYFALVNYGGAVGATVTNGVSVFIDNDLSIAGSTTMYGIYNQTVLRGGTHAEVAVHRAAYQIREGADITDFIGLKTRLDISGTGTAVNRIVILNEVQPGTPSGEDYFIKSLDTAPSLFSGEMFLANVTIGSGNESIVGIDTDNKVVKANTSVVQQTALSTIGNAFTGTADGSGQATITFSSPNFVPTKVLIQNTNTVPQIYTVSTVSFVGGNDYSFVLTVWDSSTKTVDPNANINITYLILP